MSVRNRDMLLLLKQVESMGAVVRLSRGGHWKVTNPDNRRSVCLPATSSDYRAVRNAIARLRRIGLRVTSASRKGSARKSRLGSDPDR